MGRYWNGASETDINILNQALDMVHARNIATIGAGMTLEEEQKAANIYEDTRDLILSRFCWNFALNSGTILNIASSQGLNAASIPYPFSYMSDLPNDCLRVLKVSNYTGIWKRYLSDWFLCDINTNTDDLEIRYIKKITDTSLFDPNFREVLIIRLASKFAFSIGDKQAQGKDYYAMELKEIKEAMRIHAVEDQEFEDEDTHEEEDEWVLAGR